MSFFTRLFNWGKAEANAAMDKLEDPVKMTDQGLRDLKNDLNESLKALAEVKAVAIRTRREMENAKVQSAEYEQKAMLLLQKASRGEMAEAEADRLASVALEKKEQNATQAVQLQKMLVEQETGVAKMEQNIQRLKAQISTWENEAKTLKARARVSAATTKINKQLSNVDSNGTMAMLERMKEKVDQQEALAQSYGEMADTTRSVDEEINKALVGASSSGNLLALKAKMGLLPSSNTGTDSPSQQIGDGSKPAGA